MMENKERMTLYTAQKTVVLDTLKRDEVYHVKKSYIREKYREVAPIFLEAYSWLAMEMEKKIQKPEGAEYPVWVFPDKRDVEVHDDTRLMVLEVPPEKVLLFEQKSWNRILNLSYIGDSDQEEEDFQLELERQGIGAQSDIILTAYYPQLKHRIKKSWQKLFEKPVNPEAHLQGALWEIRAEWIQNREELGIGKIGTFEEESS